MAKSGWWTRTRGLPTAVHGSWVESLRAQPERPTRVLAWATTADGYVIASPSVLSVLVGPEGGEWTHLGWHEVERGGWQGESGRLGWTRYGGDQGEVELTEAGRLPEVFRERVAASIVLEKFVPILNQRSVLISGRRDLADTDVRITWNTTLQRGLSWQQDGVQEAVEQAVRAVQTEYDMG